MHPSRQTENIERQRVGQRSTLVSVAVNIVLTALQFTIGIFAQSQALVADAIHSLSDLISDGVVLLANKHSLKGPDLDHPYGHLRFETAASLAIGVLLLTVGVGMIWNSITKLQDPSTIPTVHITALYVALIALIGKEALFHYMLRAAKKVRSTMLIANAWHARSDAASSLVVALGIIANLSGLPIADPLAALIVGLIIMRIGWTFSLHAFNDLVDKAVDDHTEGQISALILSTPGIQGIHDLKTRKMGDMIWVEVDLEMDGTLTIEAGHAIAVEARSRVMAELPVLDVMTHFDPVEVG
ncbi:cation diffusion facilitator family transporter [Alcaligenaceae bacterium CGII-47]|nr:cation diffusion facilitator family transporter [Alcaligenaceae bacterium CGII-47]